jgi:hypothetical protein
MMNLINQIKTIILYIDTNEKPNDSFFSYINLLHIHPNDHCIFVLKKNHTYHLFWKKFIIEYFFHSYHISFVYKYPQHLHIKDCISHMILYTNIDKNIYFICYSKRNDIKKIKKKESYYYIEMNDMKLRCITSDYLQYDIYDKNKRTIDKIIEMKRKTIKREIKESWKRRYERYLHPNENDISLHFKIKYIVINLEERRDRYERFQKEIQNMGIEVERFEAIKTTYEEYPYIKKRTHQNQKYINSMLGCKWSHLKILEDNRENEEYEYICIFEDDMKWREIEDISNRIYISLSTFSENDGNILYLGVTNKNERERYEKPIYLLNENEGLSTVGYIIPIKKIQIILDKLYCQDEEIDVIYSKYIEKRYIMEPNIVIQQEDYSNILHKNVNYNEYYL